MVTVLGQATYFTPHEMPHLPQLCANPARSRVAKTMSEQKPIPARLFVLLARSAPVGVILRRGPSDWVQLIHWDTRTDTFTPGQWFHGRIYEHKCDLSPGGQLLMYHAYKPGNGQIHPDYGDRWTAISRPPYFTALALWPSNSRWYGGGYFTGRKELLLNHPEGASEPHPNHTPSSLKVVVADGNTTLKNSVAYYVLRRDGWRPASITFPYRIYHGSHLKLPLRHKGQIPARNRVWIVLRKHYLACALEHEFRLVINKPRHRNKLYELVPRYKYSLSYRKAPHVNWEDYYRDDTQLNLPEVTWADYDQQRRLIIAKDGKLFTVTVEPGKGEQSLTFTELADFNAHEPTLVETPTSAKRW